eukprot:scaffold2889_cov407-Prasinococcus_capsulatus_cf.AAC.15
MVSESVREALAAAATLAAGDKLKSSGGGGAAAAERSPGPRERAGICCGLTAPRPASPALAGDSLPRPDAGRGVSGARPWRPDGDRTMPAYCVRSGRAAVADYQRERYVLLLVGVRQGAIHSPPDTWPFQNEGGRTLIMNAGMQ